MNTNLLTKRTQFASLILAIVSLCTGLAHGQSESLIALGRVDDAGFLLGGTDTVDGSISVSRPNTGNYEIEVTATGAFAGSTTDDYAAFISIDWFGSNDEIGMASISSVTNDVLTVEVWTVDAEDATDPDAGEARNVNFFFAIHRIPSDGNLSPTSRFLLGAGRATAGGILFERTAVDDIEMDLVRNSDGNYTLTLSKPGAFANDTVTGYNIFATVTGSGLSDRSIRVDTGATASDDEVTFNFFTDDIQDEADDDEPVPANASFTFAIYNKNTGEDMGAARSAATAGVFSVDGGTGDIVAGAVSIAGATITGTRIGPGDYEIDIEAPGAFADDVQYQYISIGTLNRDVLSDETINTRASRVSDDLFRIDVRTGDMEQMGDSNGFGINRDFFVLLINSTERPLSDLKIGRKRNITKMKGDDRYKSNAVGQKIRVKSNGAKAKHFFALENDGVMSNRLVVREQGKVRGVKTKNFLLTGGRKNVTASMKSGGFTTDFVAPGTDLLFTTKSRFLSDSRKGKARIVTKPVDGSAKDSGLAQLKRRD